MGQYYRQALLQDGKVRVFNAQVNGDDWNGLKLMEHSYLNNHFMDAMSNLLHNHRGQVVWCGDYADEPDDFKTIVWTSYSDIYKGTEEPEKLDVLKEKFDYHGKFLVNHKQRCYIDFDLYISKTEDEYGWNIHPLSLLTAVGNGRGGGDYDDEYVDGYMVGRWAGDELEITDVAPTGYSLEDIRFVEDSGYDDDRVE